MALWWSPVPEHELLYNTPGLADCFSLLLRVLQLVSKSGEITWELSEIIWDYLLTFSIIIWNYFGQLDYLWEIFHCFDMNIWDWLNLSMCSIIWHYISFHDLWIICNFLMYRLINLIYLRSYGLHEIFRFWVIQVRF